MNQDQPDIQEILRSVIAYTEDVADRSKGSERYDALCAAYLLGAVARELTLGPEQSRAQHAKLSALTNASGSLADLYAVFCRNTRSGGYDKKWNEAFEFALQQTIDKVAVSNPQHLDAIHREQ